MIRIIILVAVGLFFSQSSFSQDNVVLKGRLVADSLQGSAVHIINTTQQTGTVNSSRGTFEIEVRENDVLLFSSIQYINKEIKVTKEIFGKRYLEIDLKEDVNELAEVNISNVKLTGNLNTDIGNLELVRDLPLTVKFSDIKNTRFQADINDPQAAPDNLAFRQNQISTGGSLNILGGLSLLGNLLGIEEKPGPPSFTGRPLPNSTQIRKLFDDEFFESTLGIKKEMIGDFIFYLDDTALSAEMFKKENQLALIEFLFDQSKKYKTLRARN